MTNVPRFMVIGAFRYALGRMTYVVQETVEWMMYNIDTFDEGMKCLFIREIEDSEKRGFLGMDMDKREWLKLKEALKGSLEEE